jgi:hypothetical protein
VKVYADKPNYMRTTQSLGWKLSFLWCFLGLIIGIVFVDVGGAIFISLASLIFVWIISKVTGFFLSFQQHSGILSNQVYDKALIIVWWVALAGFLGSIIYSFAFRGADQIFYHSVFAIVYLGFAIEVSSRWAAYYVEQRT